MKNVFVFTNRELRQAISSMSQSHACSVTFWPQNNHLTLTDLLRACEVNNNYLFFHQGCRRTARRKPPSVHAGSALGLFQLFSIKPGFFDWCLDIQQHKASCSQTNCAAASKLEELGKTRESGPCRGTDREPVCVMFEKGLKRAETRSGMRRCGRTCSTASNKAKYEMSSHNDKSTSLPAVC